MHLNGIAASILGSLMLTGCVHKGPNPSDPYESFNRKIHKFNMTADAKILKPVALVYTHVIPAFVRKGVNNAFNNLDMIPSVANDILQAEGKWAIKDTWRFIINSSLGVAGIFDVAKTFSLPPHYNDLGLTFAKWGDKNSPYLVIPFLGPSTIRDGSGLFFQFVLWSPYVYINNNAVAYGLAGLRFVDLRSQLFESERLMNEALDTYSFIRDAYLQHRRYLIAGSEQETGALYIDDGVADASALNSHESQGAVPADYVDE